MTLSLQRADDRGGLRSLEKWSNSGWSNQHQSILEPSMSPLYFPQSQSQSMFPQLMEQQALLQAFVQQQQQHGNATDQSLLESPLQPQGNNNNSNSLDTLLHNGSKSSSMTDSTSDDDCNTAPENLQANCIASLGGGPMSPVLNPLLDRTASTGTSSLLNKRDYFRLSSPGGPLSPNALRESDESHGGCFKRRLDDDVGGEWIPRSSKMPKLGPEMAFAADSSLIAPTAMPPPPPVVDMDKLASMRAILFRHASQPVPSLEEIASTRPKRRNVRISKDPQSVAARLRRERISDRIRVLQRLVPGGTKMDTASMLDEAIHYVKFLKLQLQTLEQIGTNSNCDVRGFPPSELASLTRAFDLNCTQQTWPAVGAAVPPPTAMVNGLHPNHPAASLQQPPAGLSWPTETNSAFPDAMQEQFCH